MSEMQKVKLTAWQIERIRAEHERGLATKAALAERYGITLRRLNQILSPREMAMFVVGSNLDDPQASEVHAVGPREMCERWVAERPGMQMRPLDGPALPEGWYERESS